MTYVSMCFENDENFVLVTYIEKKTLNPKLEEIYIVGKSGELILLEVVLDTGFNEQFCLPRKYVNKSNLEYFGESKSILGDGLEVEESTFIGEIVVDNKGTGKF